MTVTLTVVKNVGMLGTSKRLGVLEIDCIYGS